MWRYNWIIIYRSYHLCEIFAGAEYYYYLCRLLPVQNRRQLIIQIRRNLLLDNLLNYTMINLDLLLEWKEHWSISMFLSWEISVKSYGKFRIHRLRCISIVVLVFPVSFYVHIDRIPVEMNASNQSNWVDAVYR